MRGEAYDCGEDLAKAAVEQLREAIIRGISAWATTQAARACSHLGVALPVREALHRLAAEGFLVIDRSAAPASPISTAELEEIYEVRTLLEGGRPSGQRSA